MVLRAIKSIRILALHGNEWVSASLGEAVKYIQDYTLICDKLELHKFEIIVVYTNGDKIEANFRDKDTAINFLNSIV